MIFEQKVEQSELTESERIIAEYIITNRYNLNVLSTRDIARETYTSSSSVVRLSQKLSYKGFEELKQDYINEIKYIDSHFQNIDPNIPFSSSHTDMQIANIMSSLTKETTDDTMSLLHHDILQKSVTLLEKAQTIHIVATENNLHLAQLFKYKMLRIGKTVVIENSYGNLVYSALKSTNKDCVLAISYSGESHRILEPLIHFQKSNVPIVALTSVGENSLKILADYTLEISTREKLHSKIASFTTEHSISLILDILYSCIFSKDYQNNLRLKVERTKELESNRMTYSSLLKED